MNETKQMRGLSVYGIALVVAQLFRLLFGGFLIGFDLYYYNDLESASSVLVIYAIIGIFTALFLLGKRYGLIGLIALSVILIIMQSLYIIVYFSQTTMDLSLHDPIANLWATLLNYLFPLLTIAFSFKVYRET
ncbi:MAG: hypothetical protein RTU30_10510 [Candidatus Thorarchaeota archaeon]